MYVLYATLQPDLNVPKVIVKLFGDFLVELHDECAEIVEIIQFHVSPELHGALGVVRTKLSCPGNDSLQL
jgi:hypothetical protein